MSKLEKESGLYFDSDGVFVTEREYIKEWCSEIVGDSGDDFYERHGFDYDLDDDEVYEDFLWSFHEQIDRSRKDGFTIDLNTDDLQKSQVSLERSKYKYDFEECDFETTTRILEGFDITTFQDTFEFECEDVEYIAYLDNGELVFKLEDTDTTFNTNEFKDHLIEKAGWNDEDLTLKDIEDKLNLRVVELDKTTDLYALFEMKYADIGLPESNKFVVAQDRVYDSKGNEIRPDSFELKGANTSIFTEVKRVYENEKYSDVPFNELKHKNTKLENGLLYTTFALEKNTSKTFTLAISPELENRSSILLNSKISKNEEYFDEFIKDSNREYSKLDSKESLVRFMCVKYKKNAEQLKESEKHKSESYDKPANDEKNVRRSIVSI